MARKNSLAFDLDDNSLYWCVLLNRNIFFRLIFDTIFQNVNLATSISRFFLTLSFERVAPTSFFSFSIKKTLSAYLAIVILKNKLAPRFCAKRHLTWYIFQNVSDHESLVTFKERPIGNHERCWTTRLLDLLLSNSWFNSVKPVTTKVILFWVRSIDWYNCKVVLAKWIRS